MSWSAFSMADARADDRFLRSSSWPRPTLWWTLPGHCPHLSSGSTGAARAGSSWMSGHCMITRLSAVHVSKSNTKYLGTFCGFVSSMMVIFPIHLGDYESTIINTETIRELVTGFLCRLTCKTMPDQRFRWLGYALSENLTIGFNHKRLLITFYLTHKKKGSVLPRGLDQVSLICGVGCDSPSREKSHALCSL